MTEEPKDPEARPMTAHELEQMIKTLTGAQRLTLSEELKLRFTYHPPKEGQPQKYEDLRARAYMLALFLVEACPHSLERNLALTRLEEVVFWANASIARRG